MANETGARNLARVLLFADALIFAALTLIALRQTEQARLAAEERALAREVREFDRRALEEAPRYSGLTVEVQLIDGDQVRRATVQVEEGEATSSWLGKLDAAVRGLELFK